jgi:F-type H+-transporting ATPase subunit b
MAVAPLRLAAQEPAPKPEQTSAQSTDTARPEAAKSEEEENNVYRHTALVESVAKVLHLPVETTARGLEFINFAIIALAIGIPLFKVLPKVLRKRSKDLGESIASARKVTEDANARLTAVEAKLSSLDEEIAKFRSEVEQEMKQDEVRIKASIEEERTRIVASAEQEITAAAAQARRGLKNFAADLAIEQAGKQLVLTPETDRALIAEFIRGAGTANGGQK